MSKRFSKQTKEKARAKRAAGMTYVAIAKELGCSPACVRYWCDAQARYNNGGRVEEDWARKTHQQGYAEHAARLKQVGTDAGLIPEAEHQAMISLYAICKKLSKESGYPHEVDHIKPVHLGGEHRIWNLRIVPRYMNRTGRPQK